MVKKQSDVCELFCYNKSKVTTLKKSMLSGKKVIGLTDIFRVLADKLEMSLAELDLYMWYMKTGEILK